MTGNTPHQARFGARAAAVILAGQWSRYIVQIISVATLSRLVAPEDFGLIAIAMGIVLLASIVGDLGLSTACLQRSVITTEQRSNLFWINTGLGAAFSILFNLAAPWIATLFGYPELRALCHLISPVFLLNGIRAQYQVNASRMGLFGRISVADAAGSLCGFAVAVALVLTTDAGAIALAAQQLVTAFVALIIIVAHERWIPGLPRRGVGTRSIVSFGAMLFVTHLVGALNWNIDSLALGWYQPAAMVGFYGRANQISSQPIQQTAVPLTRLALPRIAQAGDDPAARFAAAKAVHAPIAFVCAAFMSAVAANGELAGRIILGPQWTGVGVIITILSLGALVQISGYFNYWILTASGNGGVLLRSELVPRLLIVAAVIVCARVSVVAVAAAMATLQLLMFLSYLFYALPRVGVSLRAAVRTSLENTWYFIVLAVAAPVLSTLAERSLGLGSTAALAADALLWIAGALLCLLVPSCRRRLAGILALVTTRLAPRFFSRSPR
ncbi:MAG: oligosaccharide flippase family protein [Propionibacteriaceae bacterium]|jgi:PST family polysaccharide transporter|nr:oligosaccharide flippase family protein [Propionibacteriaceae bacterium]